MFTAAATRRTAQNALKRGWENAPVPEEPVPETSGGLRVAAEAARTVGDARFELRDLYDAVRSVGRRVLVCPSESVEGDVAALCVMARDVCKKPIAVVVPDAAQRRQVEARLVDLAFPLGACEFGTKVIVTPRAAIRDWEASGLRGVIVIVVGAEDDAALRSGVVRTVIAVTQDRYAHPEAPTAFSPPSLWPFSQTSVAHRGPRQLVTSRLRGLWALAGRAAWAADAAARTAPRDCPVCMSPCTSQCVSACCTAAFCLECVAPWIREHGTCPGCRAPADYTTMHCITAEPPIEIE